jgi:hypothetical protein
VATASLAIQWSHLKNCYNSNIRTKSKQCREKEQFKRSVLEKPLDELESIQMEDAVKNILVTIINLVINSGEAKAMVRHLWKPVELHEQHYNKFKWESTT